MDLPAGFTLTPWPWELTRPSSGLGSRVQPNTSPTTCQSSVKSLCLFGKILLQTACIPGGDDSRSVHRLSEQPHKCRNDTRGQDTNSREQQFREKQSGPAPMAGTSPPPGASEFPTQQHLASQVSAFPTLGVGCFQEGGLRGCLIAWPAVCSSFPRKESHLQFLQRYSTKAPSHC